MRDAGGEEPDVASLEVVDKSLAGFIDGAQADGTVENVGPLRRLVPVKLAVGVGFQTHVHTGQSSGDGEHVDILLTSPACTLEAVTVVRKSHGPFRVGYRTKIGAWRCKEIAALFIDRSVPFKNVSEAILQTGTSDILGPGSVGALPGSPRIGCGLSILEKSR